MLWILIATTCRIRNKTEGIEYRERTCKHAKQRELTKIALLTSSRDKSRLHRYPRKTISSESGAKITELQSRSDRGSVPQKMSAKVQGIRK